MVRHLVTPAAAAIMVALQAPAASGQAGTVAGRITDASTGTPIPLVTVRAVGGSGAGAITQTREDGTYRLVGLPPGSYGIEALKISFRMRRVPDVRVVADSTTTIDVTMTGIAVELNPVVTTASLGVAAQKILDAPASISRVSAEVMDTRAAPLLSDYMKTMPGVSVLSGGLTQSNVVTRGFNNAFSTLLLGLQDYRFTALPAVKGNLPFLYTAIVEDIDRIEVLNGPAAALYGPNAANGVLHVITKSPFDAPGSMITIDGGSSFQQVGGVTPGQQLRIAGRNATVFGTNESWGAKVSGEYFKGTDWPDADRNLPAVFPSTAPPQRAGQPIRRNTIVERAAGEARLDYRSADNRLENTFTAGYTKIFHSNEITSTFGPTEGRNWSYKSLQNRVRYGKFFGQVFYNGTNSGNDSPTDPSGSFYLTTGIPIVDDSRLWVAQAQQGFDVGPATLVAGLDYIHTEPRSQGSLYGRFETSSEFGGTTVIEKGGYLHGTVPLGSRWEFTGAVRADQSNLLDGYQFSPRAAFVFKANASNNLRATFGRAFNSPIGYEVLVDQVVNPNQAPGFALRAIGNPAKEGWQFDRSCDASINAGLCMHSPWVAQGGGTPVASTAASAFPGFVAAMPAIINALPTLTPAERTALTGLLATLDPILSGLQPTAAQVGSYLLTTEPIAATSVTDIDPRRASFNNTWELGYKGIIKERIRVALDLWYQRRGDVGAPISLATPLVMYEPTSLETYLATSIRQGLIDSGTSQAEAEATANASAAALAPLMAAFPQGTLAFTNPLNNDPSIILTYTNGVGHIYVHGIDFAVDYQANDQWLFSGTYSWQSKIVFPQIGGAANPLMSNVPNHRASGTARYTGPTGLGFESTLRYTNTFPVNSGYYNTLSPNPFNAAFETNSPVPTQLQMDVGGSYKFLDRGLTFSVFVSNLFNNNVPNFAGTPPIGRLVMSRMKYEF